MSNVKLTDEQLRRLNRILGLEHQETAANQGLVMVATETTGKRWVPVPADYEISVHREGKEIILKAPGSILSLSNQDIFLAVKLPDNVRLCWLVEEK